MRKNLVCFMMRLALFSFLICGSFQSASAHDWPTKLAISNHVTNCFGVESCPLASVAAKNSGDAMGAAIATPNSSMSIAAAYSQLAFHSVSQSNLAGKFTEGIDALAGFWSRLEAQPEVFAAMPDEGVPPSPAARSSAEQLAMRSQAKREFVEDYMPYDFSVRDWRFGQFSYRGLSRIAHLDLNSAEITDESQLAIAVIATESNPSDAAIALGNAIHQLNDVQCMLYSELCELHTVREASEFATVHVLQMSDTIAGLAQNYAEQLAAPSLHSLDLAPRFVIYEDEGLQYLLPAGKPENLEIVQPIQPSDGANETLAENAEALRSKVLGLASKQLETIGTQFLKLSSVVGSLAEPQVASRPQKEIR